MTRLSKRTEHKQQVAQAIQQNPPALPTQHYSVIVVDPPWPYSLRESDPTHRGKCPYPSMTIEEILALPVPLLAASNCYLALWSTKDHLAHAYECLKHWNFQSKNIWIWIKTVKGSDRPRMGLGHWGRNCAEYCLIAVCGKPPCFSRMGLTRQLNIIFAPQREHSRKPDELYPLLEKVTPNLPRLDMFGRETRIGWDVWGGEANLFDEPEPKSKNGSMQEC